MKFADLLKALLALKGTIAVPKKSGRKTVRRDKAARAFSRHGSVYGSRFNHK